MPIRSGVKKRRRSKTSLTSYWNRILNKFSKKKKNPTKIPKILKILPSKNALSNKKLTPMIFTT